MQRAEQAESMPCGSPHQTIEETIIMRSNSRIRLLAIVLTTPFFFATNALADGTETLGTPSIAIGEGTTTTVAGVGLRDGQPENLDFNVDGAVVQALLYVEGANVSSSDKTPTMEIEVGGNPVTASFIGGNTKFLSDHYTLTYRADVTGLVSSGANSLSIDGLDFTRGSDGAGILVISDNGGALSEIQVKDGNDWAFIGSPGTDLKVTVPQTFTFDASNKDRFGAIDYHVGSVAGGFDNIGQFRPNSFEITVDGVTSVFSDQLNSTNGNLWDTISLGVTIPAGATSLTAQIFSRDDEVVAPGNLPASLNWVASALTIEAPSELRDLCWITTGGFHNSGESSGSKDYTFGGNVGPPPRGSWEVVDHNTGDNFHSNDVQITLCEIITLTGPDQPGGKKGFRINQASFEGVGRLNLVGGYPFTGYVQDAGEPAGKNGNDQDFFSIVVRDPISNAIVFEASAPLDGGNVQIHPPTGKKN
jgi:hypothetical protein